MVASCREMRALGFAEEVSNLRFELSRQRCFGENVELQRVLLVWRVTLRPVQCAIGKGGERRKQGKYPPRA